MSDKKSNNANLSYGGLTGFKLTVVKAGIFQTILCDGLKNLSIRLCARRAFLCAS